MMASMGPSFSPHPGGMQQHPGVPPGHHMAPGMAHNPSQPGAQPGGMPHQLVGHMGVSAPGGQMNPASLMGTMPPGTAGPNAHAMQHLSPAQAQMFQAHNLNPMGLAGNPNFQQQMQQQQRLQHIQQQQQRHMLAYGNMGGMSMGIPMQGMTAQAQMAAMRRLPGQPQNPHSHVNPAMIAQQIAFQQQQVAAQQGGNHNQNQMNHQLQGLQQAQLAALQAQQQAQQQGPTPPQQPQNPNQQQQPGQPQQQTPQQPPNHAGPGGNVPPPNQGQAQGPTPQPNQQQQPQAPPQTPQHNSLQQAQLAQAHHQSAIIMQQKHREGMKGHCLLKLMQFGEHLSGFPGSRARDDLSYWNEFVHRFFSQRGIFRHAVHIVNGSEQTEKQYEITYPALPRYFHTHFDSGVKNMQLIMDKGTTDKPLPGECHFIENTKASLVYWFEGGSHLVATGTLRAQFDAEQKFELFEFLTTGHEEFISRRLVIQAAKPAHNWVKDWHKLNTQDGKTSPEMSKKGKPRPFKSPPNAPPDLDLPQSAVKQSVGITEAVYQFLEMVEIMGQMNPLFGYYHSHPGLAPYAALEQFVSQINGQGHGAVNGQGQPMGQGAPRTPGFGQFPIGASPGQAHQMLPGSPHLGSPAAGHMQAPGMQLQASHQGTGSSGPSANTSPQSNKRRRPSTVKNEDESSGSAPTPSATPQVNGVQGKTKPPTPRLTKRIKGNPQ